MAPSGHLKSNLQLLAWSLKKTPARRADNFVRANLAFRSGTRRQRGPCAGKVIGRSCCHSFLVAVLHALPMLLLTGTLVAAAQERPRESLKLLAHWRLTGDFRDSSGNGNHGRDHGVRFATVAGHKAAQFDGRTGWIEVSPHASLRLGTGDFTIAAWVRIPDEAEQDDTYGDIVSQFDSVARRGFNLRITHSTGVTTSQPNTRNVHFGIDNG